MHAPDSWEGDWGQPVSLRVISSEIVKVSVNASTMRWLFGKLGVVYGEHYRRWQGGTAFMGRVASSQGKTSPLDSEQKSRARNFFVGGVWRKDRKV